jgi:hypothetical protein
MRNYDVWELQEALATDASLFNTSTTGYFGIMTRDAVARYQQRYAITNDPTALGTVGPRTRAFLRSGCDGTQATTQTQTQVQTSATGAGGTSYSGTVSNTSNIGNLVAPGGSDPNSTISQQLYQLSNSITPATGVASSCTTPWGSKTVQNGGDVPYEPYFSNGQYFPGYDLGYERCVGGAWMKENLAPTNVGGTDMPTSTCSQEGAIRYTQCTTIGCTSDHGWLECKNSKWVDAHDPTNTGECIEGSMVATCAAYCPKNTPDKQYYCLIAPAHMMWASSPCSSTCTK